jgi:hypothetical protein
MRISTDHTTNVSPLGIPTGTVNSITSEPTQLTGPNDQVIGSTAGSVKPSIASQRLPKGLSTLREISPSLRSWGGWEVPGREYGSSRRQRRRVPGVYAGDDGSDEREAAGHHSAEVPRYCTMMGLNLGDNDDMVDQSGKIARKLSRNMFGRDIDSWKHFPVSRCLELLVQVSENHNDTGGA